MADGNATGSRVAAVLADVRRVLASEDRCDVLVKGLLRVLDELRATYRVSPAAFGKADVAFLSNVNDVLHAIEEFEGIRTGVREVRTTDEYEDVRGALMELLVRIGDAAVARSVRRELSDLVRREKTFVNDALEVHTLKSSPLARLEAQAPRCMCGSLMTLRDHDEGYFWGCSTFPVCWRKRRLTHAQRVLLERK